MNKKSNLLYENIKMEKNTVRIIGQVVFNGIIAEQEKVRKDDTYYTDEEFGHECEKLYFILCKNENITTNVDLRLFSKISKPRYVKFFSYAFSTFIINITENENEINELLDMLPYEVRKSFNLHHYLSLPDNTIF